MADLARALPWILAHEVVGWPRVDGQPVLDIAEGMSAVKAAEAAAGKFSWWFTDDPSDPGGATAWGITLATAQRHGITTKEQLRAISSAQVAAIYRADYWRFDGIDDQSGATKLFDMCVNFGRKTAVKMAQDALNELGASLVPDGFYGPATEAAINAVEPRHLLMLLCRDSAARYRAIVRKRPESAKFLKGWLKRADALP